MCACVTFPLNNAQRGEHSSHRCAHIAHLKAHCEPYLTLTLLSMTDGNNTDGNTDGR